MKFLFFVLLFGAAVFFIPTQQKGQYFGQSFDYSDAKTISEVAAEKVDSTGRFVVVSGTVESVCQSRGCWMTIKTENGSIRSTFKDYGFFVPKDISGKEVVLSGIIREEKVAGSMEQHYLEDAGDTTKTIMPDFIIKQTFVASGVFVKQ
jgi:hypothetical protein